MYVNYTCSETLRTEGDTDSEPEQVFVSAMVHYPMNVYTYNHSPTSLGRWYQGRRMFASGGCLIKISSL